MTTKTVAMDPDTGEEASNESMKREARWQRWLEHPMTKMAIQMVAPVNREALDHLLDATYRQGWNDGSSKVMVQVATIIAKAEKEGRDKKAPERV